jgi:hypothetical protein
MTSVADTQGEPVKAKGHSFVITVNGNSFSTPEKELKGSQIKLLAGVPPEYELFEVRGENSVPIGNDDLVRIHEGSAFRAIPAGTFGVR